MALENKTTATAATTTTATTILKTRTTTRTTLKTTVSTATTHDKTTFSRWQKACKFPGRNKGINHLTNTVVLIAVERKSVIN